MAGSVPTLNSMTGFARFDSAYNEHQWTWELRSVNGRGLEVRYRLPHGFDDLEIALRKKTGIVLSRGSVNINLALRQDAGGSRLQLNQEALSDVMAMIEQTQKSGVTMTSPSPEGILSIKGVIEARDNDFGDDERKALVSALESSFETALSNLSAARSAEGQSLVGVLTGQLDTIGTLANQARKQAQGITTQLREKILTQINDLASDVTISEERLAQEVAVMAVKADVCEELDRLDAHLEAAGELMMQEGPVGRKFDFLVQEFNREANTLCSKAADIDLKKTGLELKTVIDQMREQIQNVE